MNAFVILCKKVKNSTSRGFCVALAAALGATARRARCIRPTLTKQQRQSRIQFIKHYNAKELLIINIMTVSHILYK